MTLTVRAIDAAKPREKSYKLTDGEGLYLFVSSAGGKSWRANYKRNGKQATRTYGRWPDMSLADARKAHAIARSDDVVPITAKFPTFEDVMKGWLQLKLPTLSNGKHQYK